MKVTVVAAAVNTRHLILFLDDGTEYRIPQGDSRLKPVLDEVLPYMRRREKVTITIPEEGDTTIYSEMEKTSKVVKFFRVATSVIKKLLPTKDTAEPMERIGLTDPSNDSVDKTIEEIMSNSVPHSNVDPKEDGTTVVAVVDNKFAIPDAHKMKLQIKNSLKTKNTKGVENFFTRLANIGARRGHTAQELMRFIERGDLPLTDSGDILVYKALQSTDVEGEFVDVHTRKVKQRVGDIVCMAESLVDPSRRLECSSGLHIARKEYLRHFGGDTMVLAVVRPEDVVAVPDYDANKMRAMAYHIIFQLTKEMADQVRAAEGSFTDVEGASKILANAIAGNYDAPKRRVEILDRQQNIKIHDLSNKPAPKKPIKKRKTKAQAKALKLDELENKDQAPTVNPRKIIKKVVTLSRKEQAQELYQKFSKTRDPELASKLVDLKKTSKVSWERLGLTYKQGRDVMSILEEAISPPRKPSKAQPAKKVATQPNQPKSLRERAGQMYAAMLMAGKSITAYDLARQLLDLKKSSKKSWSYLGLTQEQVKNIQDTSKK